MNTVYVKVFNMFILLHCVMITVSEMYLIVRD